MSLTRPSGHEDSVFVLSISGGKDSTAAACALIDARIEFVPVFADTGWEHPITYEYLDEIERVLGLKIIRVGSPTAMVEKIRKRAGFPARAQRWCTRELKIEPIRAVHDAIAEMSGDDTVSVVGLRADESEARAKLPEFELDDRWGGYVWRPLIAWSIEQVLAMHHRFGLRVNPLYRLGFSRVGCFPCIYAAKEEIRLMADVWPERVDEIESLEAECTATRTERNAETPDRYARSEATFFQSREVVRRDTVHVAATEADVRAGRASAVGELVTKRVPVLRVMPIRRVVEWSRTTRGGWQLPIFRDPEPAGGCFRWGLCDAPSREASDDTSEARRG